MDLDLIKDKAWQSMGTRHSHPDREPGYAYYHGQRVAKIGIQLRKLVFPDQSSYDDVIVVGSWFHDVGKGIEPHWEYGALICREILADLCPADTLEKIVEIVGSHTLRKAGHYPDYVKLVQDADILDHFGSQEIWLRFWHSAYRRRNVEDALRFQRDSYLPHISKVRQLLNFPQSIEFFDEKDRFVQEFMKRFAREAQGELCGE
ncbi:MAG: HD domain-containing protein [Firmicutes bacterium]|nr:HD domain-containing protein [Bacillota bacterium]